MKEPSYAYAGVGCYFSDDAGATMVRGVMNFAVAGKGHRRCPTRRANGT